MIQFAEVILPLPLTGTFTYAVPESMASRVKRGHRVIVPFGRKKYYTAIVASLTHIAPKGYEVKEIALAIDDAPVLRRPQMMLWEWIADYYLCAVGDVYKAAVPSGLKLESETFIEVSPDYEEDPDNPLTEREAIILQVLDHKAKAMRVSEIEHETGFGGIGAIMSAMLEKGAVIISEKLVERYRSHKETYVRLLATPQEQDRLPALFEAVKGARKQETVLLAMLELSEFSKKGIQREVSRAELLERTCVAPAILTAMAKKGILELYRKEINRFKFSGLTSGVLPQLSEAQSAVLDQIHRSWLDHDITLLHGVTSSGKTEIYMHLMDFVLRQRRQVLLLVPEIALTTQLTSRLQKVFGEKVVIYHSKFSDNERVDIWKRMLASESPCIVIGARSALFLPFGQLGLVIVDEEHETSYKQQDPAPRYNARDVAMVLARMHGAKTLLGSATPAIDTYYKALSGKYGLVRLTERYRRMRLPKMEIVNLSESKRHGFLQGALAARTRQLINDAVAGNRQAIMFLNRRGYAPVTTCKMCAWIPKCERCDVSLTYHKGLNRLVCHYCGTFYPLPNVCPACKEPAIEVVGYGTERIEDEVAQTFPEAKVIRMDLDTTRNKDSYENLINDFSEGKAQILIGTQMVTKGLDFGKVSTVAIVNADSMINFPDFRATERAFNMIEQVAGRAGRTETEGVVAIQTRQPDNPLFTYLTAHDYEGYFNHEIGERQQFNYPPFTRIIYIYLKHRDKDALDTISTRYGNRLRELFGNRIFGPDEPLISRIQSLHIKKIMLKVELNASMSKVKRILRDVYEEMHAANIPGIRSAVVYYDVDPY